MKGVLGLSFLYIDLMCSACVIRNKKIKEIQGLRSRSLTLNLECQRDSRSSASAMIEEDLSCCSYCTVPYM